MTKDNLLLNIYGEAYGEKLDTFTEVYAVRSNELLYDTPTRNPEFYAVHQRVKLGDYLFNETMILLDAETFDGGVFGIDVDLSCRGWNVKDIDITIRELTVKAVDADDDEVYYLVEYERVGLTDEGKAVLYYGHPVKVA